VFAATGTTVGRCSPGSPRARCWALWSGRWPPAWCPAYTRSSPAAYSSGQRV